MAVRAKAHVQNNVPISDSFDALALLVDLTRMCNLTLFESMCEMKRLKMQFR